MRCGAPRLRRSKKIEFFPHRCWYRVSSWSDRGNIVQRQHITGMTKVLRKLQQLSSIINSVERTADAREHKLHCDQTSSSLGGSVTRKHAAVQGNLRFASEALQSRMSMPLSNTTVVNEVLFNPKNNSHINSAACYSYTEQNDYS